MMITRLQGSEWQEGEERDGVRFRGYGSEDSGSVVTVPSIPVPIGGFLGNPFALGEIPHYFLP